MKSWGWSGLGFVVGLLVLPVTAGSQAPDAPQTDVRALATGHGTAIPGPSYAAGWFHRFLFGSSYRTLWSSPLEAPILDLGRFAGGLTPTGTGGGKQTLSLRFVGADGKPYTFRVLNKDPSDVLPQELQDSYVEHLFRDQTSSSLPTAHLVVPPLLDALGILHVTPQLAILPDSDALGEYRAEFAGKIGMIEEYPVAPRDHGSGFADASEVISSDQLLERLNADPAERVDLAAYLAARLLDVLIGDWDRHRGQWRWANLESQSPAVWRPIPEDRDQAFSRYDGLALTAARNPAPQLTKFGPKFPSVAGATWNGRDLDRQFLVLLDSAVWDSVTTAVTSALTDSVLARAVAQLPPEHDAEVGEFLLESLRSRRGALPEMSRAFYRQLMGTVDLPGTNTADHIRIDRVDDRRVEVTATWDAPGCEPFRRQFDTRLTKDLRIHLRGGDDQVEIVGEGDPDLVVRVLCTAGADTVQDRSRHRRTRVYDERPRPQAVVAEGVSVVRKPYTPSVSRPGSLPPPDRGSRLETRLVTAYSPDFGFVLGGGLVLRQYGFRRHPFQRKTRLLAAGATGKRTGQFLFNTETRAENSRNGTTLNVLVSGLENPNFYGLGNETPRTEPSSYYRMEQTLVRVRPSWEFGLSNSLKLHVAGSYRWYDTELDTTRFIGQSKPYGSDPISMVTVGGGLEVDTRDRELAARRGVRLMVMGGYTPELFGVERGDFTSLEGEGSVFWTPFRHLTLATRMGGRTVWGSPPFEEAARLGGLKSLRGYPEDRFAGRTSAYGTLELRVELGDFFLLLPNTFGLLALGDVGRVWLDGEDSQVWHHSWGGGIWIAPASSENATIIGVAVSPEETRMYFGVGFGF